MDQRNYSTHHIYTKTKVTFSTPFWRSHYRVCAGHVNQWKTVGRILTSVARSYCPSHNPQSKSNPPSCTGTYQGPFVSLKRRAHWSVRYHGPFVSLKRRAHWSVRCIEHDLETTVHRPWLVNSTAKLGYMHRPLTRPPDALPTGARPRPRQFVWHILGVHN